MDLYHDMQFCGIIYVYCYHFPRTPIKTTLLLCSQFSKPYFDLLQQGWMYVCVHICIHAYLRIAIGILMMMKETSLAHYNNTITAYYHHICWYDSVGNAYFNKTYGFYESCFGILLHHSPCLMNFKRYLERKTMMRQQIFYAL
jgi:hypothetical protein